MKILKIDDQQGYFAIEEDKYLPLDKLKKEDLLKLVELTLEAEVELDEFIEDQIKNQAHQIIYKNVYGKLTDLKKRKKEFKDETERLFLDEYEKYKGG